MDQHSTSKLCASALKIDALEPWAVSSIPNGADLSDLPESCHEQDPTRLRDQVFELLADLLADKAVQREDAVRARCPRDHHGRYERAGPLEP